MRHTLLILATGLLSLATMKAGAQGMAVNGTGAAANTSAMLDVSSTTQGMLIPRMTNAQRAAISSPATGLLVYCTDATTGFYFYNGSAWNSLNTAGGTAGGDLTGSYPNPTIGSSASTGNNIVTAINASGGGLSGTELATGSVSVNAMSATGTRNSTTYLRGDNTWNTVGTVTSVSTGNLSPLFTCFIVNSSTTPSFNFALSNAAAYSVLTNSTNATAAPAYGKVVPQALYSSIGTPSSSTYYRGDGSWQSISSSNYIFSGMCAPSSSTPLYFGFPGSVSLGTVDAGVPMPTAFTLTNFYITGTIKTAGGSGNNTYTLTLYKNGSATSFSQSITAITSDPAGTQYNANMSGSLSVFPGDVLSLQLTQSLTTGPVADIGTSFLGN